MHQAGVRAAEAKWWRHVKRVVDLGVTLLYTPDRVMGVERHSRRGNMQEVELEALRARVRDLETALGQNNGNLAQVFKLPPKLGDLLGLLMNVKVATAKMIEQRIEIATSAKVAIFRLRQHMKHYDIHIEAQRGCGYWLSDGAKDRIRERLTPKVTIEDVLEDIEDLGHVE